MSMTSNRGNPAPLPRRGLFGGSRTALRLRLMTCTGFRSGLRMRCIAGSHRSLSCSARSCRISFPLWCFHREPQRFMRTLTSDLHVASTIAWQLLRLRHVARRDPSAPGNALLTTQQFETLTRLRSARGEPTVVLTVQHVIDEISRLGVHLPNNGPPRVGCSEAGPSKAAHSRGWRQPRQPSGTR